MTYWILIWFVTVPQYCNSFRTYDKKQYEIFKSTDALYRKYNELDSEGRANSRIFGGSEYEIKPLYEIKVAQKGEQR